MPRCSFVLIVVISAFLFANFSSAQEPSAATHADESGMHDHSHGAEDSHAGHAHDSFEPAEYAPPRQNFLRWFINALGCKYAVLLPFTGLLSFVLTLVLITRGKGPYVGAALVFIIAMPFLIGLMGMFDGTMSSLLVMSTTDGQPKPSKIAEGISTALVTPIFGMVLMVPSYLLATAGLFLRSMRGDTKGSI